MKCVEREVTCMVELGLSFGGFGSFSLDEYGFTHVV